MKTKTYFAIVITVLITVMLMQNQDEARFKFLFWELVLPKLVMLTGFIFLGIILGFLLGKTSRKNSNYVDYENTDNKNSSFDTLSEEDRDYIS